MARRVEWTETAWTDLEATADHIADDSSAYAASFVREIRDAARSLKSFPNRGRKVPEFEDESLRELIVHNRRLIYFVSDDTVHVLGLIHAARDLEALWDEQDRSP